MTESLRLATKKISWCSDKKVNGNNFDCLQMLLSSGETSNPMATSWKQWRSKAVAFCKLAKKIMLMTRHQITFYNSFTFTKISSIIKRYFRLLVFIRKFKIGKMDIILLPYMKLVFLQICKIGTAEVSNKFKF